MHALGPPRAPGARPRSPWRFPHPHRWRRARGVRARRARRLDLLGRDRGAAQLAGRELRGARPRLPAGGDRRGVPLRPARGHPDGDRGGRRCSTPCCCRPTASRRPTRASGCCSPRCCSRARPWPSWPPASGGARSRPTSASARRRSWPASRARSSAARASSSRRSTPRASPPPRSACRPRASCSAAGRSPGQVALPLDVDGRVIGRLELMGAERRRARATRSPSASRARWRACWRSRRSASGSPTPTSRPRRCAPPTRSRRRSCAPSRTSCARR